MLNSVAFFYTRDLFSGNFPRTVFSTHQMSLFHVNHLVIYHQLIITQRYAINANEAVILSIRLKCYFLIKEGQSIGKNETDGGYSARDSRQVAIPYRSVSTPTSASRSYFETVPYEIYTIGESLTRL